MKQFASSSKPAIRLVVGLLTPGIVLAACSSSPTSPARTPPSEASVERTLGTSGDLIPIDSDNVAMAGYDESTQVMTVLFDEGRLYEYYDVPPDLWMRFVAAQPDPWSTIGYPYLVKGGYDYRRIS